MTTTETLNDKEQTLNLVLFNAQLGKESITEQVHIYHQHNKQTKWLVTHLNNIHQSLQYIHLGASGIVTGSCDIETFQAFLQSIANDQIYLDNHLTQILAFRQLKKILEPFSLLTPREFDVFCLLAENYPIKTIATELGVTEKTAFNCQTQLRKKLNLINQQQTYQLAKNNGLIL